MGGQGSLSHHERGLALRGAGSQGKRHRRTVFRDIGTRAWYDYLGWANPVEYSSQRVHFGRAQMKAGCNLLVDRSVDFTALPLEKMLNLHVHWGTKEAWTGFFDEREALIEEWGKLGKLVFVMTGDLHKSFAIQVTDNIWEFCCGPHNSLNHVPKNDESDRPTTGKWKFGPRECDLKWSSDILPDVPRLERLYPHFCVVQVNNVGNMPQKLGGKRLVAYPHPQVIFQYFDGWTGALAYAQSITRPRD